MQMHLTDEEKNFDFLGLLGREDYWSVGQTN